MAVPDGYSALDGSERPRPDAHRLMGPVEADQVISVTLILRPRPGSPPLPGLEARPGQVLDTGRIRACLRRGAGGP